MFIRRLAGEIDGVDVAFDRFLLIGCSGLDGIQDLAKVSRKDGDMFEAHGCCDVLQLATTLESVIPSSWVTGILVEPTDHYGQLVQLVIEPIMKCWLQLVDV